MPLSGIIDLDAGENISAEAQFLSNRDDYIKFMERLYREEGIDLSQYKQNQMRRRINMSIRASGLKGYCDYLDSVRKSDAEYRKFIDRITINVTEFMRNPEKYSHLESRYLIPMLKRKPNLKLWSAGCSSGEEPYSLALLLEKHNAPAGAKILGWDFDKKILDRAREGIYDAKTLALVSKDQLKRYFTALPDGRYQVGPELRRRVSFERHNLLEDNFPGGVDIILCRNVVIYFKDKAKEDLYVRFARALDPEGVFMIGASERISNMEQAGLFSPEPFFYVRKESSIAREKQSPRPARPLAS
ncbi:protein-glutamate O-methyltransferase CheR [bacterium]|nr:protein-glutamate O-methyltransferase CheR [bacterium]